MNPLLSRALENALPDKPAQVRAAVRIMSAIRGPDTEDLHLKQVFTTPVRLWVVGEASYGRMGFTHKVKPIALGDVATPEQDCLNLVRIGKRFYDAAKDHPWQSPNFHYIGHACLALAAIAYLEGWDKPEFREWFSED